MGKSGEALRALKENQVKYHFTTRQMIDHDNTIRDAFKQRVQADVERKTQAMFDEKWRQHEEALWTRLREEWDDREKEFKSGGYEEQQNATLKYLLALTVNVLVERFKWKAPDGIKWDKRNRVTRYAEAVVDELMRISDDEMMDIRTYAQNTFDNYHIKFYIEDQE